MIAFMTITARLDLLDIKLANADLIPEEREHLEGLRKLVNDSYVRAAHCCCERCIADKIIGVPDIATGEFYSDIKVEGILIVGYCSVREAIERTERMGHLQPIEIRMNPTERDYAFLNTCRKYTEQERHDKPLPDGWFLPRKEV
jgi:hypothetical protein